MPQKQQIIVILLFTGGYVVSFAGAIRTYYTYKELSSLDETWEAYPNWISSSVELYVGVVSVTLPCIAHGVTTCQRTNSTKICASIPATKPFFVRYLPRLLDDVSHSTRYKFGFGKGDKTISTQSNTRNSHRADLEMGDIQNPFTRLNTAVPDTVTVPQKLHVIKEVVKDEPQTSLSSFVMGNNGSTNGLDPNTRVVSSTWSGHIAETYDRINSSKPQGEVMIRKAGANRG